jgi:predicted transcriptional regulator of viral defense system
MDKLVKIWRETLNHKGFFSLDQITEETEIRRKYVGDVLSLFMKEGFLKRALKIKQEHRPGLSPRFSIVYMISGRKGLERKISPRLRKGTAQDRLWSVIRVKKNFNLRDLIIIGSVKKKMARWYLSVLRRKGIIRPSRTGGGPGVIWGLVEDLGVRRPFIGPDD